MAKYKDTATYPMGQTHAIRNRQTEYVAAKKANVIVAEMFCGKKKVLEGLNHESGDVTCRSCNKIFK